MQSGRVGVSPYIGRVELDTGTELLAVTAAVNDIHADGWLGQITSTWPIGTFVSGSVHVELSEGDHDGWDAHANVNVAGMLTGTTSFRLSDLDEGGRRPGLRTK